MNAAIRCEARDADDRRCRKKTGHVELPNDKRGKPRPSNLVHAAFGETWS